MAYDTAILDLLREVCADITNGERKMFGSYTLMLDGHMLVSAWEDGWLARVGPDAMEAATALGTEPFAPMGGKGMKGIVYADVDALEDDEKRDALIGMALRFVGSLPPK
ncbi:MAG: TfoX/Sxy family protein [Pseudomonadota bacterium]